MQQRITLPLLLIPALMLGACGGTYNGGLDSVYQPVVQRTDYVFDLQSSGYGLAPGEAQRLDGWLAAMRPSYGDHLAVDDGGDGAAGRDEIALAAKRYDLLLSDRAPITAGPVPAGTVRVVLTRTTASVPNCPDYTRQYAPDYEASTSSNFGCASNRNLAAMVANPVDLVRGQPGAETADPVTVNKSIKALRDAAPSGGGGTTLKSESPGGGSQ